MARASADITNTARERWLLRIRDPDNRPPPVITKVMNKPIGSKRLIHGEWVEVVPEDEDAAVE